jgi:hypothetical protein
MQSAVTQLPGFTDSAGITGCVWVFQGFIAGGDLFSMAELLLNYWLVLIARCNWREPYLDLPGRQGLPIAVFGMAFPVRYIFLY